MSPPNVSTGSLLSWFPPVSCHTFSTTLSYPFPARPFVTFSHTALSATAGNLFFGMFFMYFILPFQLSHVSHLCQAGAFPALLLILSVLLVVLEHPSTFLDVATCIFLFWGLSFFSRSDPSQPGRVTHPTSLQSEAFHASWIRDKHHHEFCFVTLRQQNAFPRVVLSAPENRSSPATAVPVPPPKKQYLRFFFMFLPPAAHCYEA